MGTHWDNVKDGAMGTREAERMTEENKGWNLSQEFFGNHVDTWQ